MSDVKDNGGLTLPYPTIFLFYDGEEPEHYTALTGENLNRPLKQLMANIKKLQSAIASGGMDDALLGILNSKMSIAGGNFIGPVTLPSWSDAGGDIPDNALINKGDIVQLINDTSGSNKARALATEKSCFVVDYNYTTLTKNPNIDVSRADETNQTICFCRGETTKALNLVAHLKFSGVKSDAETLIKFHNLSKAGSAPMTIEIGSTATFAEPDREYPVTFPQFSLPPKITLQPNEYATLRCILNLTSQPFVAIEVPFGTF